MFSNHSKYYKNEQTYDRCIVDRFTIPQSEIDIGKVKSMLKIVDEYLEAIQDLKNKWITIYQLNYNIIHTLCKIFLIFDKIK